MVLHGVASRKTSFIALAMTLPQLQFQHRGEDPSILRENCNDLKGAHPDQSHHWAPPWSGPECSVGVCPDCHGRGRCDATTGCCACEVGYTGCGCAEALEAGSKVVYFVKNLDLRHPDSPERLGWGMVGTGLVDANIIQGPA